MAVEKELKRLYRLALKFDSPWTMSSVLNGNNMVTVQFSAKNIKQAERTISRPLKLEPLR